MMCLYSERCSSRQTIFKEKNRLHVDSPVHFCARPREQHPNFKKINMEYVHMSLLGGYAIPKSTCVEGEHHHFLGKAFIRTSLEKLSNAFRFFCFNASLEREKKNSYKTQENVAFTIKICTRQQQNK